MKKTLTINHLHSLTITTSIKPIEIDSENKKTSTVFLQKAPKSSTSPTPTSHKEKKITPCNFAPPPPPQTLEPDPQFIEFDSVEDFYLAVSQDPDPTPPPLPLPKHGIAFPADYNPEDYQPIFAKLVFRPPSSYISSDSESDT